MTAHFVEIAGQEVVLLSKEEFDRLRVAAESYEDIVAAIDARKQREMGEEYVPKEVVDQLLAGANPLRVWRNYRGLSMDALGLMVDRKGSFISKLEKGHAEGGIKLWQMLAKALNVDLDDLIEA